jgi:2-keto-4-pentenoate hydratase
VHGYVALSSDERSGRLKAGQLLLTGGLGAAVRAAQGKGALRDTGRRTVTYARVGA